MKVREYVSRIGIEKKVYENDIYNERLVEKAESGMEYFLGKFQSRVEEKTGKNVWNHFISIVNKKWEKNQTLIKILSIGSGPGGAEIGCAKQFSGKYEFDCLDINENSVQTGQKKCDEEGLNFKFYVADANYLILPKEKYDVIFAHASLHHLINHQHIANQIKKSMKKDAKMVVYDVIVRNGMRLWPETKIIANRIFKELPKKYKRNNKMRIWKKRYFNELPDKNVSRFGGFECINSEETYSVLKKNFKTLIEVPGFAFARRFVDNPFAENYDVKDPIDRSTIDEVLKLDEEYSKKNNLKPESVFLVLENE